jgi:hypothetical protein
MRVVCFPTTQRHTHMLMLPQAGTADRPYKAPLGSMCSACCCITPSDGWHALIVAFVAVFPVTVFCTSVVTDAVSIGIACGLLFVTLMVLCFAVTCDPGIVPPASATGDWRTVDEQVEMRVNEKMRTLAVCRTCRVPRPPRSGHCSHCDTCVREYDHHCGVLGACVGERTFRFFALFMHCGLALCAVVLVRSVWVAAEMDFDAEMGKGHFARWHAISTIGCCLYTAICGCCLMGQAIMYTQLACTGKTQKDLYGRLGDAEAEEAGAGSNGCAKCVCRLFGPMPRSEIARYAV